jgi:hypothetical protein
MVTRKSLRQLAGVLFGALALVVSGRANAATQVIAIAGGTFCSFKSSI